MQTREAIAEQWLALHYYTGSASTRDWATFRIPHPFDFNHL